MMKYLVVMFLYMIKIIRRIWMYAQLPLFKKHGENVTFGYGCDFSYPCIEFGNDVFVGAHAKFLAAKSLIKIGNKVMFGPGVTILGGDHRTNLPGEFMFDIKDKLPENDQNVVIEDDVWIGANVIILKGVTIGRGSVVGAGSIVVKNIPAYSIYVGSYPVKTWPRWSIETITAHEKLLRETQT